MLHHTAATRWDTGKLLRIIRSISVGVNYLHTTQPAVLHRDLKPGNIFVDTGQARDCSISGVWTDAAVGTASSLISLSFIRSAHAARPLPDFENMIVCQSQPVRNALRSASISSSFVSRRH